MLLMLAKIVKYRRKNGKRGVNLFNTFQMNSLPHQVPLPVFFAPVDSVQSKQGRNDCEIACLYGGLV